MPKTVRCTEVGGHVMHYLSMLRGLWTALAAAVIGAAAAYWSAAPEALRAALLGALCTTIADTLLGVVVAFSCPGRKFSSHAFGRVFSKLLVYLCTLLAAFGMDLVSSHVLGSRGLMQLVVAVMICFREIGSVLEHSAVLGVPWPEALQRKLDTTRKRVEECMEDTPAPGAVQKPTTTQESDAK